MRCRRLPRARIRGDRRPSLACKLPRPRSGRSRARLRALRAGPRWPLELGSLQARKVRQVRSRYCCDAERPRGEPRPALAQVGRRDRGGSAFDLGGAVLGNALHLNLSEREFFSAELKYQPGLDLTYLPSHSFATRLGHAAIGVTRMAPLRRSDTQQAVVHPNFVLEEYFRCPSLLVMALSVPGFQREPAGGLPWQLGCPLRLPRRTAAPTGRP